MNNNKNLSDAHVMDNFERIGMWNFPDFKCTVAGLIKYHKGQNITLDLIFSHDNTEHVDILKKINPRNHVQGSTNTIPKIDHIRGILESGEHVLLDDCMLVNQYYVNQVSRTSYRVSRMISGNVMPNNNVEGNRISIPYTSLYTWLLPETIDQYEDLKNCTTSFTHTPPENLKVAISNGLSLEINYGHSFSIHIPVKDFTILQSASVALVLKNMLDLDRLYDKMQYFRNFLMLATDTRIQPKSIRMHNTNNAFTIFWNRRFYDDIEEEQDITKMNFNYRQIEQDFGRIIKQWFKYCKLYAKSLDLYFESKLDFPLLPINITFLRLAQSLEALHRLKYNEEMELKKRLTDLIDTSYDIFKNQASRDKFVNQVSDVRHYFSHGYLKNKQNAIPSDDELIRIIYRLDLLMFACIIMDSGLPGKLKCNVIKNKLKNLP